MTTRGGIRLALSGFALAWLAGCSGEDLSNLVDKGKEATSKVTETVKEKAPAIPSVTEVIKEKASLAGSMDLTLDAPAKIGRCYVTLVPSSGGRPAVLQISSCQEAADESFPAALFQAEVTAATLPELANKKLPGQFYAQVAEDGPVWHSAPAQPVELTINVVKESEKVVEGEVQGPVLNSGTGQETSMTGKFSGVIQ
jgi:hypothetical protein